MSLRNEVKNKIALLSLLFISIIGCTGCGKRIDYSLPPEPVEFKTTVFENPQDKTDTYLAIEYNGKTYIGYGDLKGSIDRNDVGKCLGYYVQDGEVMKDVRFCELNNDPDNNFLVRFDTVGVMSQPDFFRAVDSKEKDILIPNFIEPSEAFLYWNE